MKIRTELFLSLTLLIACSSSEGGGAGSGGATSSSTTGGGESPSSTTASTVASTTVGPGGGEGGATGVGGAPAAGGGGGEGGSVPFPEPEECELYTTKDTCLAAGCGLFMRVQVIWAEGEDVCIDSAYEEREMCFQLDPAETWGMPAGGVWYRDGDEGIDVIFMPSSYCGVLGWTPCASTSDSATPLCGCINGVCGEVT